MTSSALISSIVQPIAEEQLTEEQPAKKAAFSTNKSTDEVLEGINKRHLYMRLVRMSEGDVARLSKEKQLERMRIIEDFAKASRPKAPIGQMSVKAQQRLAKQQAEARQKKIEQNSQGRWSGEKKASAPAKGRSK